MKGKKKKKGNGKECLRTTEEPVGETKMLARIEQGVRALNARRIADAATTISPLAQEKVETEKGRSGGEYACTLEDVGWGLDRITTNNIHSHLKRMKHASQIPEGDHKSENQNMAALVPMEKSLVHTRNKKITW